MISLMESPCMTSYQWSIVTIWLSLTIFKLQGILCLTSRKWFKVTNDYTNGKPMYDFLSMVNSNHMVISDHFQVIRHFVFDLEKKGQGRQ